ncbi:MAG: MauE/DoxX family redox-associated membrane protein [Flavobacteriales bacterium]
MKRSTTILRSAFGALMILGGIAHFLKPELYASFIPDALPMRLVNYLVGALELSLGVGVFFPRYRYLATLGIFILMVAFLPLHVVDAFRDEPVIGSKLLAYVRLPIQFVLIGWAWFLHTEDRQS